MDLRVACVVACLCALALASTAAGIPKCCVKTRPHVPYTVLQRVYRVERQYSTGACDIDALLLYVRGLKWPICVGPKVLDRVYKKLAELKA